MRSALNVPSATELRQGHGARRFLAGVDARIGVTVPAASNGRIWNEAMLDTASRKELKELNAVLAKAAAFDKKGMLEQAARSYRFFLSRRPEPAAYFNYGRVLKKLGSYDDAIQSYERAIALKPDYAEAYANIANIHMEQKLFERALEYHHLAVRHGPTLAVVYYNRGVVLQELGRHDEALADYDRTLTLQPDYYLAYLNKSVILYELKQKTKAAANYRQILASNPESIDALWNLGILKLSEGDFAEGWKLSEARLRPQAEINNQRFQKPYWDGTEGIAGKTLLIVWEQGFGDTIQFCRYALLAKNTGARIVLSVQNPLRRLISTLDNEIEVIGEDEIPEHYDYYCFLMSLPHIFKTSVETIPYPAKYLRNEPAAISRWSAKIAALPGLKVGLVWAGGERANITCARRNDANRSLPLTRYIPFLELKGAAFFSLQKGPPAAQVQAVQATHEIHDWTDSFTDFADTGALIEHLDLVITVDTSVAHLAAALGKPVWVLVPWVSCWRWLERRSDSPWYASVRLFRQAERGNWDPVINAVAQALRARIETSQSITAKQTLLISPSMS
jgi:tetratricopeptide (TPR) repeat protein